MDSTSRVAVFVGGPIDGQHWPMTEEEWQRGSVSVPIPDPPPDPLPPFREPSLSVPAVLHIPKRARYLRDEIGFDGVKVSVWVYGASETGIDGRAAWVLRRLVAGYRGEGR